MSQLRIHSCKLSVLLLLVISKFVIVMGGDGLVLVDDDKRILESSSEYEQNGCKTDMDCSLMGDCVNGKCRCDPGWSGKDCSQCNLLPADKSKGYNDRLRPSWGGHPILVDGKYHLFASYLESACPLHKYGTNSAILHAVSDTPDGPYVFKNTVLAPFHHGATIAKHPDGTYLIYADGKDIPAHVVHRCNKEGVSETTRTYLQESTKDYNMSKLFRRGKSPHDYLIVASSKDINAKLGEWKVDVIMQSDFDAPAWNCNRTNPTPLIFPNGTVLLGLRTTSCNAAAARKHCRTENYNHCQHITIAESKNGWKGPYIQRGLSHVVGNEDPILWKGKRGYYLLMHSKEACAKEDVCGVLAYSKDSYNWHVSKTPAYNGRIH